MIEKQLLNDLINKTKEALSIRPFNLFFNEEKKIIVNNEAIDILNNIQNKNKNNNDTSDFIEEQNRLVEELFNDNDSDEDNLSFEEEFIPETDGEEYPETDEENVKTEILQDNETEEASVEENKKEEYENEETEYIKWDEYDDDI